MHVADGEFEADGMRAMHPRPTDIRRNGCSQDCHGKAFVNGPKSRSPWPALTCVYGANISCKVRNILSCFP